VICDFCGFLAQVKTTTTSKIGIVPKTVLAAAWGPQKERMDAAIYFPLYLVVVPPDVKSHSIFYLPAGLQDPSMFQARSPLSPTARRAGWQGFTYNFETVRERFVRIQ
jgi:hypothetical protein